MNIGRTLFAQHVVPRNIVALRPTGLVDGK